MKTILCVSVGILAFAAGAGAQDHHIQPRSVHLKPIKPTNHASAVSPSPLHLLPTPEPAPYYGLTYNALDVTRRALIATEHAADWAVGAVAESVIGLILASVKGIKGLKDVTWFLIQLLLSPFVWVKNLLLSPFPKLFKFTSWIIKFNMNVFNTIFTTAVQDFFYLPIKVFSTVGTAAFLTFVMGTRRVIGTLVRLPFVNAIDFLDSLEKIIEWSS